MERPLPNCERALEVVENTWQPLSGHSFIMGSMDYEVEDTWRQQNGRLAWSVRTGSGNCIRAPLRDARRQRFQRKCSSGETELVSSFSLSVVRLTVWLTSVYERGKGKRSGEECGASVDVRSFPEGDERLEELLEEENLIEVEVKTEQ
ncbi:hypothetical protein LR48_Vigan349s001300 [Vigna angularis]|uniref:Uncharacterized protein n=1 Tax=Phaseolus angularis TaxID=3914 RepID=A0A0L9TA66_PHAAN|nr:hypothetical protein LR48_Vigan349s001300 [Vigna angularis]